MNMRSVIPLCVYALVCSVMPSFARSSSHEYPSQVDTKFDAPVKNTKDTQSFAIPFGAKNNHNNIPTKVPCRIIVKYKTADAMSAPFLAAANLNVVMQKHGVVARRQIFSNFQKNYSQRLFSRNTAIVDLSLIYELTLADDSDIESAVSDLKMDANIVYAFQSMMYRADMTPNDPIFSSYNMGGLGNVRYPDLWGAHSMNAQSAWDISQGEGAIVAVVDTGLDYNHQDIWGNVWVNSDVISDTNGDGVINLDDVDTNGDHRIAKNEIVDNMFGWDFTTCKGFTHYGVCIAKQETSNPYDDNGHGTHVSGTIAAVGNNAYGLIGIAPKAKIMPIKALTRDGFGFDPWLASGIVYAVDHGATVINNSWGCDGCGVDPLLEDVARYAHSHDVVVVFAAGNSSVDMKDSSPTNMDEVIAVAACTPDDKLTFFSNYGTKVATCAPGGGSYNGSSLKAFYRSLYNIVSLKAKHGRDVKSRLLRCVSDPNLVCLAGTSMASPHAAGEIALIRSHNPAFTADDVKWVLNASARDIESPGFDYLTGPGALDAYRALQVDSVISVGIDYPYDGTIYDRSTSSIGIGGSVVGTSLTSYQLFYGEGRTPHEWHQILSGTASITHDYFGSWDVSDVANGMYTIRLIATSTAGWQFQTITSVYLDDTPQRVAPSTFDRIYPKVSDEMLIWQEYRFLHGYYSNDIRTYDIVADQLSWMSTDLSFRKGADISHGKIVSMEWDFVQRDWDLAERDISVGETTSSLITHDDADQFDIKIDGNAEAWLDCQDNPRLTVCILNLKRNVYLRNRTTGIVEKITDTLEPRIELRLSKNIILWSEFLNGVWRIRGYNMDTKQFFWLADPDASSEGNQRYPTIDYPYVAWNEFSDVWRLRACNINNCDNPWWISSPDEYCIWPAISKTKIVCTSSLNWNWDIEIIDVLTLERKMLTADPTSQEHPTIDKVAGGWRVAWMDSRWVTWNSPYAYRIWQIATMVVPE